MIVIDALLMIRPPITPVEHLLAMIIFINVRKVKKEADLVLSCLTTWCA